MLTGRRFKVPSFDAGETSGLACVICRRNAVEAGLVCSACRGWLAYDLDRIYDYARVLPAATAPTRAVEGGIPLRLAVVDLGLPARGGADTGTIHDEHGDQLGEIPAAARLGSWVQDWIEVRGAGERVWFNPSASTLADWLYVRLDWACDHHQAIDEFAKEIRTLLAAMRRALDLEAPAAVTYRIQCPHCLTATLVRAVGATWIECHSCGRLWSDGEYGDLVQDVMPTDRLYTAAEATVLCRVTRDAIYKRVKRGKLTPIPGPWGGRMMFAVEDLTSIAR